MWQFIVVQLCSFGLAGPGLPEAPPPRVVPIRVTGIDGGTLTITATGSIKVEPAITSGGPRVRLTTKDVTLEATNFVVTLDGKAITLEAGADGRSIVTTETVAPKR